jgi:hypothetical protein
MIINSVGDKFFIFKKISPYKSQSVTGEPLTAHLNGDLSLNSAIADKNPPYDLKINKLNY